jgi:RNA polymerase sigma-70 factor (ECF subfamily)
LSSWRARNLIHVELARWWSGVMIAAQAVASSEASGPRPPRANDSAWIAEAYEAHAGELAAYVARSFGGRVIPEDVVHEAFARLVRDAAAGRAPVLVRPWLYRVAHNLAVDELRRPIRLETGVDDDPARDGRSPSVEDEYETWSLSPELRRALGSLSRARRTSILMAAEGYTGREIAGAVGRSELATRALLCRTRRMLRETLAGPPHLADAGPVPWLAA